MKKLKAIIMAGVGIVMLAPTNRVEALNVSSNFSTDPLTGGLWSFGAGSNVNSQFAWDSGGSSLLVHVDSSLPTARLDLPIGATLTTGTDFTLTCRFSFKVTSAPFNGGMQFAFGLVNHSLTRDNRTGLPTDPFYPDPGSTNVFNTVEFNYFPSQGTFGGPTLTPSVFGAQNGGGDAFGNFASVFGLGSRLDDNIAPAITALPQDTLLLATLGYSAATQMLSLTMQQVNPDLSLTTLDTGVPALSLSSLAPSFAVDSLAIMTYADGYASSPTALVGDMNIRQIAVSSPVPEPSAALLLLCGGGIFTLARRRRV